MIILYAADLETRNFTFTAFSHKNLDDARALLIKGLKKHGRDYNLLSDWYEDFLEDVQVRQIETGACYRGGEKL